MLVAFHRQATIENVLANILTGHSRLKVIEAVDGEKVSCAHLYVGRGQDRIEMEKSHLDVSMDLSRMRRLERINDMFKSIAQQAGPNAVGVILSGMLWDGVDGLKAIRDAGGYCVVQDPEDAEQSSMPREALAEVEANFVGDAGEISEWLVKLASNRVCGRTPSTGDSMRPS